MEYSSAFVVVLGVATTFIGLICIIFLAKIMSLLCRLVERKESASQKPCAAAAVPVAKTEQIPNRGELVAAISAVIAEDMGKDVSSIRILSLKKV